MIHIWLRRTVNWLDEDAFWAQVEPRFRPRVELWNEVIDMPFHVFRHRVAAIAALNLSRVRDVVRTEWEGIPEGGRVVPVDDDDWFAPNLAEVLNAEWGEARGISWNPLWIGIPSDLGHRIYASRRALLPFTPGHWTCDTNNYALIKAPESKALAERHELASDWFDGPGRTRVRRISSRLSVHNRSLGSQTSLRPTVRRGELDRPRLLHRLARYKRLYRRRRWPREPAWARPYMRMMAELMDELEPS